MAPAPVISAAKAVVVETPTTAIEIAPFSNAVFKRDFMYSYPQ